MENKEIKNIVMEYMMKMFKAEKRKTLEKYKMLNKNIKKGQILFVGSSLMEWFPINEMQLNLGLDKIIYNRGIAGTTTSELLEGIEEQIFKLEPSKIFINIGSNDIGSLENGTYNKQKLINNYDAILKQVKKRLPKTEVYMMAYYPINGKGDFGLSKEEKGKIFSTRTNENIKEANETVELLAEKYEYKFINVNEGLEDSEGNLKKEYSVEGLHMWPNAYEIILKNMLEYLK